MELEFMQIKVNDLSREIDCTTFVNEALREQLNESRSLQDKLVKMKKEIEKISDEKSHVIKQLCELLSDVIVHSKPSNGSLIVSKI